MGKLSQQEDAWQAEATAQAVADARSMAQSEAKLANTPVGKLSEQQWGWIINAGIFAWIKTRYQQAVAEGLACEEFVTRMSPSPRDSAIVQSILKPLASQAKIDWSKKLAAWSKQEMTDFVGLSWALIKDTETVLEQLPDTVLHKPEKAAAVDDGLDIPEFLRRDAKAKSEGLDDKIPF
jgi:hypothetical protein